MNTEPRKVKLEYHHEERGNCLATFKGIGEDAGKWFNKMTYGKWYYTYPHKGYYENSHEVEVPCVFSIYGKGLAKEFAVDSNIPALATKPYEFLEDVLAKVRADCLALPGSIDVNEWERAMLDCDAYKSYKGYKYNFLFFEVETLKEVVIDRALWAGRRHDVVKELCRNKISGREYWVYFVRINLGAPAGSYNEYLNVNSFQATK